MLQLYKSDANLNGQINLSSSKSESNRVLLMNALSPVPFELTNLSDAKDTQTMIRLLQDQGDVWDVMEAGTTMRFCTAYLGVHGKGQTITGTERMKNRPIGLLVDALRKLGSDISYLEKEGYPPMKIDGLRTQKTREISIPGNISSQFISALLMIAPTLPEGLKLTLTDGIFSRPYIEMTLGLMSNFGIEHTWEEAVIDIAPQVYQSGKYQVESDWSGASYWYAMAAVAPNANLLLTGLKEKSFQGDQAIVPIMKAFGVDSTYESNGVRLTKNQEAATELDIDFNKCPDLAQGVMVAAALKGITLTMTGLETLYIKETDRVGAMRAELAKIGATLEDLGNNWILKPGSNDFSAPVIQTYEDHRMAMAFGPLSLVSDLQVEEPGVVAKSYPGYWEDLKSIGVKMN
ncbi:MAG: 3-phosphoshikimate 1-carboxyvinyltransferase [Cytophagales bacterium]|nr:3-phosphoshikimate 1-carboxyvinyltransferase [Cytophagales bacterium]